MILPKENGCQREKTWLKADLKKKLEEPGFDPTKTRSKISIFSIYKRDPILGQKGRIWTQLSKLDNMNKIGPYGQKFDNMDTIGQCGQKGTKN